MYFIWNFKHLKPVNLVVLSNLLKCLDINEKISLQLTLKCHGFFQEIWKNCLLRPFKENSFYMPRVGKYLPHKKSDFLPDGKIFTKIDYKQKSLLCNVKIHDPTLDYRRKQNDLCDSR